MDDHDALIAEAMARYKRGLAALESGDSGQLATLAGDIDGFPHGEDPYFGS